MQTDQEMVSWCVLHFLLPLPQAGEGWGEGCDEHLCSKNSVKPCICMHK
ncbi:hypothetical protein MIZ03_1062 [Rhodoferax lithotrophicus]|uniref:Uncharacterized protein n=1 Tax=Rhodoferax lithotrophicus TaxID=2798804 RepID=A0ABN6D2H5_9BURK|nr:hypothetical protein MIZ03_1062 [Rhodoferax sp. MIZ03]